MDEILELADSFGRSQKAFLTLGVGYTWLLVGANTMLMLFVALEPPRFAVCENSATYAGSGTGGGCVEGQVLEDNDCTYAYRYHDPMETITTEWHLGHCENLNVLQEPETASSFYFAGFLLGVSSLGVISDMAGRLLSLFVAISFMNFGTLFSAFAHSIYSYSFCRFLTGIGTGGSGTTALILCLEMSGSHRRQLCTAFGGCIFAVGSCFVAVTAYFVTHWRTLTLICSLPGFPLYFLACAPFVVESPRWFASCGRTVEAIRVLRQIAKNNGRTLPDTVDPQALALLLSGRVTFDQVLAGHLHIKRGRGGGRQATRGERGEGASPQAIGRVREGNVAANTPWSAMSGKRSDWDDELDETSPPSPDVEKGYSEQGGGQGGDEGMSPFSDEFTPEETEAERERRIRLDILAAEGGADFSHSMTKTSQAYTHSQASTLHIYEDIDLTPDNLEEGGGEPHRQRELDRPPSEASARTAKTKTVRMQRCHTLEIVHVDPLTPNQGNGGDSLSTPKAPPKDSLTTLCSVYPMNVRLSIMLLAWFAASFTYYGLSLNMENLKGEPHVIAFISALTEMPAIILSVFLTEMPSIGRKGFLVWSLVLGGGSCLLGALLQIEALATPLAIFGRFFCAGSYNVCYLYGSELFPTSVRSAAVGFQSMSARVAGIVAPQVVYAGHFSPLLPLLIFGSVGVAAGLAACSLGDTLGKPMHDTVAALKAAVAAEKSGGSSSTQLQSGEMSIAMEEMSPPPGMSGRGDIPGSVRRHPKGTKRGKRHKKYSLVHPQGGEDGSPTPLPTGGGKGGKKGGSRGHKYRSLEAAEGGRDGKPLAAALGRPRDISRGGRGGIDEDGEDDGDGMHADADIFGPPELPLPPRQVPR
uniref:Major facilitator superfamily (MFS) profile domain-containing protein n=1 Tax=Chromera velia CCMP2878 TaxID=1169474 RepID=A0A0G4IBM4_9ALVE|eukprot:Cvel_12792.t1-p1 / transcript=Cvel_12792.t1 / gene=Cvel_12792 / organism=Chromera_velia_CCMP2878 / gene_product=Solute carrier family 22 member 6-A, putative / transcript_product=Solute carrier family 22 member 6-A, putative / location=Cvel_scaffold851:53468-58098(-) / protein_length=868 / sequence_SO=supercontig / SO=protein_coding / is_pseudo=false